MQGFRTHCIAGIPEKLNVSTNKNVTPISIPTTLDLKKARRFAAKKRISAACSECRRVKRKCGELRPCDRCISLSLSRSCDATQIEEDRLVRIVERPVPYAMNTMHFRRNVPFPDGHLRHQWASIIIRSFWEIGFKYSSFMEIFNSVPATLSASIMNMLRAVNQSSQSRAKQLGSASSFQSSFRADSVILFLANTDSSLVQPDRSHDPARGQGGACLGCRLGHGSGFGGNAADGGPLGGGRRPWISAGWWFGLPSGCG